MINLKQNLFAEISELQSGRVSLVEFLSEGCDITRPTSYSHQYIKNRVTGGYLVASGDKNYCYLYNLSKC